MDDATKSLLLFLFVIGIGLLFFIFILNFLTYPENLE